MNRDHFIVPPGKKIRLKDYDPGFTSHYKNKDEASAKLRKDVKRLAKYQDVLYAQNTYAVLVMLLKRTKLAGIRQPGKNAAPGKPGAPATPEPAKEPAVPANPQPHQKAAA